MEERIYYADIIPLLIKVKDEYREKDKDKIDAAIYLIKNMTNLQAALYDPANLDFISQYLDDGTCFNFDEARFEETLDARMNYCESCPFYDKEKQWCKGYDKYMNWMKKPISEEKPWKFYLGKEEEN